MLLPVYGNSYGSALDIKITSSAAPDFAEEVNPLKIPGFGLLVTRAGFEPAFPA